MKDLLSSPFRQALLCWILLNLFLVHCFVYWNWDATDGTNRVIDGSQQDGPRFNFTKDELKDLLAVEPLERVELFEVYEEPLPHEVSLIEDNRDKLRRELEKAEEAMKQTQEDISWLKTQMKTLEQSIEELDVELAKMEKNSNDHDRVMEIQTEIEGMRTDMPKLVGGSRRPEAATLLSRLMYEARDLADIQSTDELKERFEAVIQGIDKEVSHAIDMNWSLLTTTGRYHFPVKNKSDDDLQNPITVCPTTPDDGMDTFDEGDLPTEAEVEALIKDARKRWNGYYEEVDIPLLLPESLERLATKRDALVQEWKTNVEMKAHDRIQSMISEIKGMGEEMHASSLQRSTQARESDVPAGSCIQTEQAEAIVEAAMRAFERKQDLRRAILTAMSRQGIDTSTIILDAILGDGQEGMTLASQALSKSKGDIELTWRQVLDNPITKSITQSWLPFAVDVVGGYSDRLDEWLDSSIPVEDLASGKILTSFLEIAGEHKLPPAVADWFLAERSGKDA